MGGPPVAGVPQVALNGIAVGTASALSAGLFNTEAVGRSSPFLAGPVRIIDDVEYATMEWVDWFNNRRLHSILDYVPPEENESAYYGQTQGSQPATPQP